MDQLILKQYKLGPMDNFVYLLGDKNKRKVAAIDPAWDADFYLTKAKELDCEIECVILTHGHYDHTNALEDLLEKCNVPVYISAHEAAIYRPNIEGLNEVKDQDVIKVGSIEITCLHTPGHTPGGQCLKVGNHMLTGDTLFVDGCGRVDLPASNPRDMVASLKKLKALPKETVIYPGHNYGPTPTDTLARQLETNPYFRGVDKGVN